MDIGLGWKCTHDPAAPQQSAEGKWKQWHKAAMKASNMVDIEELKVNGNMYAKADVKASKKLGIEAHAKAGTEAGMGHDIEAHAKAGT